MSKHVSEDMYKAIDELAKAVPNGELNSRLGPVVFLGSAADHIAAITAQLTEARAALAESRAETTGLVEACEQERRNRFEAAKEWRAEVSRLTERLATISSRGANAVLVPANELARLRERHEADLSRASEITRGALADRVVALKEAAVLRADLEINHMGARGLISRLFGCTKHFRECACVTCEDARAFLAATHPGETPISAPTLAHRAAAAVPNTTAPASTPVESPWQNDVRCMQCDVLCPPPPAACACECHLVATPGVPK